MGRAAARSRLREAVAALLAERGALGGALLIAVVLGAGAAAAARAVAAKTVAPAARIPALDRPLLQGVVQLVVGYHDAQERRPSPLLAAGPAKVGRLLRRLGLAAEAELGELHDGQGDAQAASHLVSV
ncbi:MAG: hypothetical protein J3K34DRAFT_399855 [Monoraphidium minutum]|nr:MAG: hypothetical protein J3K34DRAFT_399855 [Monoraphidium minutum]